MRTVTVTGRGMESIPATIALINLGVEAQGKTAQEVQQEVARRSSAVVELLRSRNVEKLQTTGIRLSPNYTFQNNVQRLIGYIAVNTVSFRMDAQRVGNLLDEAVNAGATRIDGISFVAAESAIAKAQEQALREATLDAQRQADAVLATLNLTRQEVVSIQVNGAAAPPPPPIAFRAASADRAENQFSTPVVGGEQQVEASVTLQIRY
ncbi:MAG TPA: SIMPL domain-containing protein [Phormidium sp.]